MNITKQLLVALRADLDALLPAIAQKHGVSIQFGRGTFTSTNATLKLEIAATSVANTGLDAYEYALKQNAASYGLTDAHLNQVFKIGRDSYVLSGYDSKKRTKCFIIKRLKDNKSFICDTPSLKQWLGIVSPTFPVISKSNPSRLHPLPYPGDWSYKAGEDWTQYDKRTEALFAAIKEPIVRFQIADGYAQYAVLSLNPLQLQHIPYGDAYQIPYAHIRGLTTQDVMDMLERDKKMKELFAKKA